MANEEPKPCMVLEGEVVPIELVAAGCKLCSAYPNACMGNIEGKEPQYA